MLTVDQVSELVKGAVTEAFKAINTVAPEERPAAAKAAPTILTRKQQFPNVKRALRGAMNGKLDGLERDMHDAGKAMWYQKLDDGDSIEASSVIWPRNPAEMLSVLREIGETKSADRVASAIAPRNALRRVPGVRVIPVTGHDIRLPRETTRAGASQAAEAGTLSSADATLASQTIVIEKQYAMRRWSSELAADSDPAFSVFLNKTLLRDLDVQQDIQWLRGTGSTPQVVGLINYSGLTTSTAPVAVATNGASLTYDDFMDAAWDLDDINANADFAIGNPRVINTLRKKKDANGRYLASFDGTPRGFGNANNPGGPDAIMADFLPFYKTTNLIRTQTVGTSTDCTTVIIGDSSQVLILERQGVELMVSPHVY